MSDESHVRRSSELQFMARLAERGFSYAGQYLEQRCHCSIGILGPDGDVLYLTSDVGERILVISNKTCRSVVSSLPDVALSYCDHDRMLFCSIALDSGRASIILFPIEPGEVDAAIGVLEEVQAPLTYHLVSHQSSRRRIEALEKDVSVELFAHGCGKLATYALSQGYEVDEANGYFVTVTRLVQGGGYDWAATTEHVRDYLHENDAADVIDIGIADGFVHVFPDSYVLSEHEKTNGSQRLYDLEHHKRVHDERNGIVTTVGVGRAYPFTELEQSLHEATQALELGWLMGKGGAVMRYDRLGVFTLLLDSKRSTLESYYMQALGPLVESETTGAPLLDTLRLMLDHSFRWADVAHLLFVHVNTLRYRMDKISELLDTDIGDASVRADLYIALKLYDLLHISS